MKAKSMHFNESRFSKPWNIHLFTSPSAIKAGMFLGCHNWPWTALLTLWDAQNVIHPLWLLRVSSSVKYLVQRCIRFLYTRYNETMDKNYTINFSWPTSSHSICHRKENLLVLCIKVKSYCETKLFSDNLYVPSIGQTWDETRKPRQARGYSPTHSFCIEECNNCIRLNLFNLTTRFRLRLCTNKDAYQIFYSNFQIYGDH